MKGNIMNKKSLLMATLVACIATAAYARGGAAGAGRAAGAKSFGAAGNRATSAGTVGNVSAAQLSRNEFGGFGMTGTNLASTQAQPSSKSAGSTSSKGGGTMIGPVNDNGTSSTSAGATKTRAVNMGTVPANANAGASNSGTTSSKSGGTMIGPVNDNGTENTSNATGATRARTTNTAGTVPSNAREGASGSGGR